MKSAETYQRKVKLIAQNRKARHDFEVLQVIETGIILQGTEVKSLRIGKCSIQDAYAWFPNQDSNELILVNLHISPYEHGNTQNHEPKRPRKLLVTQREAVKLRTAVQEKGLTLIPLSLFFSGPFVKVEIGLVKSKRKYDKREATKERETDREIRRKFRY
jgi:SsrA-binding protein